MTYYRCDICGRIHEPFCTRKSANFSEAFVTSIMPYAEAEAWNRRYNERHPKRQEQLEQIRQLRGT